MWVLVFGKGCVLSTLIFIIYTNWWDKLSRTNECVTIGSCKIIRLLFAGNIVLLASSESGLQRALNGFAASSDIAGMKIISSKTEILHLSRNPVQCFLQVIGISLKQVKKFKYVGVAFISDVRQDEEFEVRSGKTGAVKRGLLHSLKLFKRELSRKAKLSVFSRYSSLFSPMIISLG